MLGKLTVAIQGAETDLFGNQFHSYTNGYEGCKYPICEKPSASDQIMPMSERLGSFSHDENVENCCRIMHARSTTKGEGKSSVNPREQIDKTN
eukprot:3627794-Ditylum_brightwellii.AAC.1